MQSVEYLYWIAKDSATQGTLRLWFSFFSVRSRTLGPFTPVDPT